MVHGRMGELQIYELLGHGGIGAERPAWTALYATGLEAYRAGNYAAAIGFFQMLLSLRPSDGPSRLMIERCRRLLDAAPAPTLITAR